MVEGEGRKNAGAFTVVVAAAVVAVVVLIVFHSNILDVIVGNKGELGA
jgi:hypothetical protein